MKKKNPAAVALGSIKSDKKAAAARINGLKGGKPKNNMKKIIIAVMLFAPVFSFAYQGIEVEVKGCKVTMGGPAVEIADYQNKVQTFEVFLNEEPLKDIFTEASWKSESWTKTLTLTPGKYFLTAIKNGAEDEEYVFKVEPCTKSPKVESVSSSKSGSYTLAKRCEKGMLSAERCFQVKLNEIAKGIEKVTKMLAGM